MKSGSEKLSIDETRIACIRKVKVKDLPEELRRMNSSYEALYVLTSEEGDGFALARSREAAFSLARRNAFNPVSVH